MTKEALIKIGRKGLQTGLATIAAGGLYVQGYIPTRAFTPELQTASETTVPQGDLVEGQWLTLNPCIAVVAQANYVVGFIPVTPAYDSHRTDKTMVDLAPVGTIFRSEGIIENTLTNERFHMTYPNAWGEMRGLPTLFINADTAPCVHPAPVYPAVTFT